MRFKTSDFTLSRMSSGGLSASDLSCVWIETGNPRNPLACVWIDPLISTFRASEPVASSGREPRRTSIVSEW